MRRPRLESLEARDCPATLDVTAGALTFTGGAGNDTVTQYISGVTLVIHNPADTTTLTAGAIAAGWKGNGTNTVTGPVASVTGPVTFRLGDGNDVFNLRNTSNPVSVNGEGDNDTVNVSSNAPANTGNLASIDGDVTVDGGTGTNTLKVSDQGATSGNANVVIGSASITGLAGPSDGRTVSFSGLAALQVIGSANAAVAETFTVDAPAVTSLFQLNMNGGPNTVAIEAIAAGTEARIFGGIHADTVHIGQTGGPAVQGDLIISLAGGNDEVFVHADSAGTISTAGGDDTITIDAGVTWDGDVHTGDGADTVNEGAPAYGLVTGVIT